MDMEELLQSTLMSPFDSNVWYESGIICLCVVLGVVALILACNSLWLTKEHLDDNIFTVTRESIDEQSYKIKALLSKMKASKREITNTLLLLEEIVVRLHENTEQVVTAHVRSFLGTVSISLTAKGKEYNPFAEMDWNGKTEDVYRDLIFYAHRQELSYSRRGGSNVVVIRVHQAGSHLIHFTFASMILGIICGFGMKWLPQEAATFISESVISTIQTLFMNSLSLLIAPVVFFSLVTSLSSLSSKNIGRISGKVISTYLFTTAMSIVIALGISWILFSGEVPPLPESVAHASVDSLDTTQTTLSSFLISIIPKNLVSPIANGSMIQILFIAVFMGLALSAIGEKGTNLRNIFEDANAVFTKMMTMVVFFMPIMAFVSFTSLVYSSSADVILMLLSNIIGVLIGVVALIVLNSLLIAIVGKKSPFPYLRKSIPYFLTPFALSSSSASIPFTMDLCKKKLGVSERITAFSIPLGATVNMNGSSLCLVIAIIMLARMCGVELNAAILVKISLMVFMLSVGAPGIPGVMLVCMAAILVSLGLPASAIAFLMGIDQIIDRIETALNVNGDIAAAVIVASSEKELNNEIYSA